MQITKKTQQEAGPVESQTLHQKDNEIKEKLKKNKNHEKPKDVGHVQK